MADTVDLDALLSDLDDDVETELASTPQVVDVGDKLDVDDLAIVARRWHRVADVVAVVADLKSSTKLGTNKWAASTASIYQAATGSVVKIFDEFDTDFLQIQGDGVFGLFWGDYRYRRAACAGITIKTFSESLVAQLEAKWEDLEGMTGYKVGVAASRVLVKKIGTPRNPAQQEPMWAGKAVNYATKAAQCADRHQMVVTGSVWDRFESNDYIAFSCPCGNGPSNRIWADFEIDRLPEGDAEAQGRVLISKWCQIHGAEYCDAILTGKSKRNDTAAARQFFEAAHPADLLWTKAARERRDRLARVRGLARRPHAK